MTGKRKHLTVRQRCCISAAALFALNRRPEAYTLLKQNASALPTLFLQELFIHLSLVLGFPAMLEGLEYVKKMRPGESKSTRKQPDPQSSGKRILHRIYGDQTEKLLRNIQQIHRDARPMILNDVYGKVFARPGLTLKERELINVTVLAIQGLDRQLYSHLRGSMRVGLRVEALREGLLLIQRMSGRSMHTARSLLRVVVSQRKKW